MGDFMNLDIKYLALGAVVGYLSSNLTSILITKIKIKLGVYDIENVTKSAKKTEKKLRIAREALEWYKPGKTAIKALNEMDGVDREFF